MALLPPSDPVWVGQDLVEKYAGQCAAGSPRYMTLLGSMGTPGVKQWEQEERHLKQDKVSRSSSSASASTSLPETPKASCNAAEEGEQDEGVELQGFPSDGSQLHAKGQCKPCAFFHTTGCQSGEACKFCHLCPPREVQRRKQIRRRIQREILNRTEAALYNVSQVAGAAQRQQAAQQQQQHARRSAQAQAAALEAMTQARYPLITPFNTVSLAPFAPMAAPMLMQLSGGLPGGYCVQPEASPAVPYVGCHTRNS